ncbi:ATP-dependent RNA helicase RhlE [compost metagenome]
MSQNARNTMLDRFRSGDIRTLVATDVAARGLDIEGVSHVFHYAVPTTAETYIHRSGRTGRNGSEGKTVIMVTADGEATFKVIQKKIPCAPFPLDLSRLPAPDPAAEAEPARAPRPGSGRNRQAQAAGQGAGRNRQAQTSGQGGGRNRQAQTTGQGGGRNRPSQASDQPTRRR